MSAAHYCRPTEIGTTEWRLEALRAARLNRNIGTSMTEPQAPSKFSIMRANRRREAFRPVEKWLSQPPMKFKFKSVSQVAKEKREILERNRGEQP